MSKTKRNTSIDAIKGIAIILVMIGHVFVHNHMEDDYVYDFIKAVQMPLFMIVSGYLCGQGRKISEIRTYGKVLGKRAIAYLVPFFSWLTIMHLDNLVGAYKTIFVQLDYGLWFLAVLFILTFMVYTAQLASGWLRKKGFWQGEIGFWAVYGTLCLVLVGQIVLKNNFLSPGLTILYIPFYMLGYVAGDYGKRFFCWNKEEAGKIDCRKSHMIQAGMIGCAISFLVLIVAKDLDCMETKLDIIAQMIASLVGNSVIIYVVFLWKEGRIKDFFAEIGRYTLEIYVVHYHFANILNLQDKQYDFYTLQGAGFVLASFAVMCAITFVCVWILKKIKILDFLLFGKLKYHTR